MTPKMIERSQARMKAILACQQAMRNEESDAAHGLTDEVLNAFAVAVVLAIECEEIEGLSASWAS